MEMLAQAALLQARNRLARMVGPVVIRVPAGREDMLSLAQVLADGELLTVEEWEGEQLTLQDGYGRPTGICFMDMPEGQEFSAFVDGVLAASRGGAILSPLGRQGASALPHETRLWVLTTPA